MEQLMRDKLFRLDEVGVKAVVSGWQGPKEKFRSKSRNGSEGMRASR